MNISSSTVGPLCKGRNSLSKQTNVQRDCVEELNSVYQRRRNRGIWVLRGRKEGIMESEIEKPSFWDIRTYLLSSLDFAEGYVHHQPEHASDVARFSQELRRLKNQLMSSFEKDLVQAPLHDIVHGLTSARAMAEIMAERHPEKCGPLTQFVEGLKHAQAEFMGKILPQAGNSP